MFLAVVRIAVSARLTIALSSRRVAHFAVSGILIKALTCLTEFIDIINIETEGCGYLSGGVPVR